MPDEVAQDKADSGCKTTVEYLLYKLDRTLVIVGIVTIALVALFMAKVDAGIQIAVAAVGVLGGYLGGRSGK